MLKRNRNIQGKIGINQLILWFVAIIALVLVVGSVFNWNLPRIVKDTFPDLDMTKEVSEQELEIIAEQQEKISEKDKNVCPSPECNNYPMIHLRYFEGFNDDFFIRWNFNLDKPQIIMNVNFVLPGRKFSEEWSLSPNLDNQFISDDLKVYEMRQIEYIMDSSNYIELIQRVLGLGSGYVITIGKGLDSEKLTKQPIRIEKKTVQEVDSLLRQDRLDSFKIGDEKKSSVAKNQIKIAVEKIDSFKSGADPFEIYFLNLAGWYLVSRSSGDGNNFCLCPTEKCVSEFSVCEISKKKLERNYFLDKEEKGIRFGI